MAFPGSGYLIANDILAKISYILIEPVLETTLGTTVTPGVQTVTPATLFGGNAEIPCVYVGAMLIVGFGSTQEVIAVSAFTDTTLTATFVFAHASTDALFGATFPVAQTNNPFYLQPEVLGHVSDAQNDFLTRAPIILKTATQDFVAAQRLASLPADCIQMERISVDGKNLWEQSEGSMDLIDKFWAQQPYTTPDRWYEDRVNFMQFGIAPIPGNAFTATLLYAQRDNAQLALNEGFLLPDPFLHWIMYGALAELFGKDGEQRDPARAQYCAQRFDLGVKTALRVYDNIMQQQPMAGGQ